MHAVVSVIADLPQQQRQAALGSMLTQIVQHLMASLDHDRRTSQSGTVNQTLKKEDDNQTLALFDRLTVILR